MAIKNKDGSVYQLRGPNPLMNNQEQWDMSRVVLHNFSSQKETVIPDDTPEPVVNPIIDFADPNLVIHGNPKTEPIEAAPEPEEEPEFVIPPKPVEMPKKESTSSLDAIHCLPAKIKRRYDDLYQEDRSTIQYGNKFLMMGKIVEVDDIQITIWTPVEPPSDGSILFPGDKSGGRWWKVTNTAEASKGFWIRGEPSDFQPSFD